MSVVVQEGFPYQQRTFVDAWIILDFLLIIKTLGTIGSLFNSSNDRKFTKLIQEKLNCVFCAEEVVTYQRAVYTLRVDLKCMSWIRKRIRLCKNKPRHYLTMFDNKFFSAIIILIFWWKMEMKFASRTKRVSVNRLCTAPPPMNNYESLNCQNFCTTIPAKILAG